MGILRRRRIDYVHDQVAVRALVVGLLGSIVGMLAGIEVGLLFRNSLGPVVGGVAGWFGGGLIAVFVITHLFPSAPRRTVSVRTACTAGFGLVIGSFVGDFVGSLTVSRRDVGAAIGAAIGIVVGASIGIASTKRSINSEHQAGPGTLTGER